MGRQNGDATMVNSSIALLQERFRELQRIREKRQEKEILKMFSAESESRVAPTVQFDQPTTSTKLTFQPDQTILPHRPSPPQDSLLSLGLSSQSNKHPDYRAMKSRRSPSTLWPNSSTNIGSSSSSSRNFENSSHDVDTSLHL